MTEETPKLLPCPFCGNRNVEIDNPKWNSGGCTDYEYFNAICIVCGARSYEYDSSEEEAAKSWNKRA